jgi:hypothetical protein
VGEVVGAFGAKVNESTFAITDNDDTFNDQRAIAFQWMLNGLMILIGLQGINLSTASCFFPCLKTRSLQILFKRLVRCRDKTLAKRGQLYMRTLLALTLLCLYVLNTNRRNCTTKVCLCCWMPAAPTDGGRTRTHA